MMYLKIVMHNQINEPLYLDILVPPELVAAMKVSRITRAEFLLYEKGGDGKVVFPRLAGVSELNAFKKL